MEVASFLFYKELEKNGDQMKHLKAKLRSKKPAITITRIALLEEKLVYIACANKPVKYPHDRSRIVYIGTTGVGAFRIASSAAFRAKTLLKLHGIKQLDFFVVISGKRTGVSTWEVLESELLLTFRSIYGKFPEANKKKGKKMKSDKIKKLYNKTNLEKIIRELS